MISGKTKIPDGLLSVARSDASGRSLLVILRRCSTVTCSRPRTQNYFFPRDTRRYHLSSLHRGDIAQATAKMGSTGQDMRTTAVYPGNTPQFMQFPSRRSVVHSTRGIVACTQPLAAEAGQRILKQGGNAAVRTLPLGEAMKVEAG
jgi:hypothetical protein